MIALNSTYLRAFSYDLSGRELQVFFHHRETTTFADVDLRTVRGLVAANEREEVGKYFRERIEKRFRRISGSKTKPLNRSAMVADVPGRGVCGFPTSRTGEDSGAPSMGVLAAPVQNSRRDCSADQASRAESLRGDHHMHKSNIGRRQRLADTEYELRAMRWLNSDQQRDFQQVSRNNRSTRNADVLALTGDPSRNRFMLWGQIRTLARGIHRPSESLTSVSISQALRMLTETPTTPAKVAPAATAAKAAA